MSLKRPPPKPAKVLEDYTPRPRDPAPASGVASALGLAFAIVGPRALVRVPKTPDRKMQAIRDSAKGEGCLIRLPFCPGDPKMTIWSHNRHQRAGKGGQIKALDLCGAYGCTYCDAIYDGQAPRPAGMTEDEVELAWYQAHDESLVKLRQKGLV